MTTAHLVFGEGYITLVGINRMQKSKLQLKLERLAQEKAIQDAKAAELKKEAEAAEAARAQEALLLQQQQQQDAALAAETKDKEEEEEDDEEDEGEGQEEVPVAAGKGEETVFVSTMFGDDVMRDVNDVSSSTQGPTLLEAAASSGKKLSNKEKRRLAMEAEKKEREVEYNKAAMKASIEGAQFAVSL